jgi:hypothetical protein
MLTRESGPRATVRAVEVIAVTTLLLLAGLTQSAFGFGFALVFTPLAALVIGPRAAVATALALSPVISVAVYWEHRPREPLRDVVPLVVAAVCSLPLGLALLLHVNEPVLRMVVGGAVVVGAATNVSGMRGVHPGRPHRLPVMVLVGLVAGVLGGATSMSGPPVVLYEHWIGGDASTIRRRLFAFFAYFSLPTVLIAAATGALTLDVWGFVLFGLPAMALGIVVGRELRPRLSERWFRRLSMSLLMIAAAIALVGAVMVIR